ncbi:MAG TPA: arginase family protein [Nitrososphaeraceae archaeon]
MIKLLVSNVGSISDADITIIGFPDDSKSDANRTGTKKGPDILRRVYNDSHYFEADGKKTPILPMSGIMNKKIFDFGNVVRNNMYNVVFDICSLGKIPIVLGGDHSVTTLALRAIKDSSGEKVCLLYFDAHPDFVSSIRDFHGSVLSDSADCIDFRRSILIGVRAAEPEEMDNISENHLECLTPLKIIEEGLSIVSKRIISKFNTRSHVYVSIDLDCIDPGFAPGVSYPTHAGLMPLELIFLVTKVCSNLPVVGLDIVELCPDYDHNYNTANIGARLLMEAIASLKFTSNQVLKEK